ncbi:uncharacterized protein LOC6576226 [Drosophila mojavensis]|uniref:Tes41 n=2 Tax=Drosophila mojavensis TaxID=7230 RepID=B4KKT4_DROMO|nr:uncharacterized protein LOC6576226 [Drosophila mojavensis]EDW11664.1 Tes41 [Drosophila mojavensis]
MPNFNGAIIMHTLQLIKTPATLREIVVTISKNIDLSQDDLMKPVKQTLDMGYRMGFLQKLNGRYFLVPMSFETLRSEMKSAGSQGSRGKPDPVEKADLKPKIEKRATGKQHPQAVKAVEIFNKNQTHNNQFASGMLGHESTTTLIPSSSMQVKSGGLAQRKPKRTQQSIK